MLSRGSSGAALDNSISLKRMRMGVMPVLGHHPLCMLFCLWAPPVCKHPPDPFGKRSGDIRSEAASSTQRVVARGGSCVSIASLLVTRFAVCPLSALSPVWVPYESDQNGDRTMNVTHQNRTPPPGPLPTVSPRFRSAVGRGL